MGRSKLPVLLDEDGEPLFGEEYRFEYGRATWARTGAAGTVVAMGTAAGAAVDAADAVRGEGLDVGVLVVSCPLDLDDEAVREAMASPWVFAVEDHGWRTGLWASLAEWRTEHAAVTRLVAGGIRGYQSSGDAAELLDGAGLSATAIAARLRILAAEHT